jgi:hypothetical protein
VSRGDYRVWTCITHVECPCKIKVVVSDIGYELSFSMNEHTLLRASLPATFKGISAEFDDAVKELVGKDLKPNRIHAELIIRCGGDESKKERVPSKKKIGARRIALSASPQFQFATFADLKDWTDSRLIESKEVFEAEQDLDKVHVLSTFNYEIEIDDDSLGAAKGAKLKTSTFGFVAASKRTLQQFRDVIIYSHFISLLSELFARSILQHYIRFRFRFFKQALFPTILSCSFVLDQVIADRNGTGIAISVDGTYRLMNINGKTWPMINGGPSANYFSGGKGWEYSTTIINVLFLFCKRESQECYEHFFRVMKTLPVTLFDLPEFIPIVVGCDRSRAIVNAREAVWPSSRSALCWIHVNQYLKQGKFTKHMSATCTTETRTRIENDIIFLHEMRTQCMFDAAFKTIKTVWVLEGEGSFATYFERFYATEVWSKWFYAAADMPGVSPDQNPIESRHSVQKKLLGNGLLKATPYAMANTSLPLILAAEGTANADPKKWPSTLQVKPRLTANVAAKAIKLQTTLKTIKVT